MALALFRIALKNCSDQSFISRDDESPDQQKLGGGRNDGTMGGNGGGTGGSLQGPPVGPNPFLDPPQLAAIEYKKGYVMRKCCYDTNYKKSK